MRKFIFVILAACMLTACANAKYETDPTDRLIKLEKDVDDPTKYHDIEALPKKDSWRLSTEYRAAVTPEFEEKCAVFFSRLLDAYTMMQSARGEEDGLIGTYGITLDDVMRNFNFLDDSELEKSSGFGFSAQLVAESLKRTRSHIYIAKAVQSRFEAEMRGEWPGDDNGEKKEGIEGFGKVIPLCCTQSLNYATGSDFNLDRANLWMLRYFDIMDRSFIVCMGFFE